MVNSIRRGLEGFSHIFLIASILLRSIIFIADLTILIIIRPQREYGAVFTTIKGEDIQFCLPETTIPNESLVDYTNCW